jgi:hypothetical protein
MLEPLGFEVFDTPEHSPPPHPFPVSINYATNLLRNGYWHAETATRRLAGWRALLDRLRPDLLVADHAPAALLASRGAQYPRAALGHGFTLPPLCNPMPGLQPWFQIPEPRLIDEEGRLLDTMNSAAQASGIPPLECVASLFDGVERFLCIEPELDHYPVREEGTYLGTLNPDLDLPAPSADLGDSLVFVYLSAKNRFTSPLLSSLRRREIPTLAYIAGGGELAEAEPPGSCIRYLSGLMNLQQVASRCRLAVIHGGTLSASLFLKQSVRLLICPQDLEKSLLGWRLVERGLAWSLNWFSADGNQSEVRLDEALSSPPPPGLAGFAARHAGSRSQDKVAVITERLMEIAGIGGTKGSHFRGVR